MQTNTKRTNDNNKLIMVVNFAGDVPQMLKSIVKSA